jgi:tetratricopeptide (TPR) repeat protein
MLRWVLGDDKFGVLLTRYMDKFRETPASTDAFISLASEVAGENLKYFFDQWLDAWGAPTFDSDYTVFRTGSGYLVRGTVRQDLDLFRMPVEIEIETDTEPEYQRVELFGPSSEFSAASVRKPRGVRIDPLKKILRTSPEIKVDIALNRGEEYANDGRYAEAVAAYQRAIELNGRNSLALYRLGESLFLMGNLQAAAQQFRDALAGSLQPRWVEVWAHINLGKLYDLRGMRDRAVSEYQQAVNGGDDSYGAQAEAKQHLAAPFRGSVSAVNN